MVPERNIIFLVEKHGLLAGKVSAHKLIKMIPVHAGLSPQVTGAAVAKPQTLIPARPQATEPRKVNYDSW